MSEVSYKEDSVAELITTGDAFDVGRVRRDFPILQLQVNGKPLVYLDNAATSQKPQVVIDKITTYYRTQNANIHRGVHHLSQVATLEYERSREIVRDFLGAASEKEIIFTRGTTEGINLVRYSFAEAFLKPGDEVIISAMEHHSNIVPWQLFCDARGAKLRIIPIDDNGDIIFEEYQRLLTERTRLVSVVHYSNSLGTINPVKDIIAEAKRYGAHTLIDGAQAVPHTRVDVQELGCDFYVFSSHKLFGPTGIGVLYGREAVLERMPPYEGGGDMIRSVSFSGTTFNDLPHKFEAGTPNIAGVIGMGAAIEFVLRVGYENFAPHEERLLAYATEVLLDIPGLRIIGTGKRKTSVISFVLDCAHPHDIGTILDQQGIAVRTGHHCTQPVMERFAVPATTRASMTFYNTESEIDALVKGIHQVINIFG
jgi:cysteine desulfurase/selenocysteine lyase